MDVFWSIREKSLDKIYNEKQSAKFQRKSTLSIHGLKFENFGKFIVEPCQKGFRVVFSIYCKFQSWKKPFIFQRKWMLQALFRFWLTVRWLFKANAKDSRLNLFYRVASWLHQINWMVTIIYYFYILLYSILDLWNMITTLWLDKAAFTVITMAS